jgi:molybdate transport system ATP-binding protein
MVFKNMLNKSKRTNLDMIELSEVTVKRGGITLLNNITWKIEEGQNWVIRGVNGSGKTLLLELLTGHLSPTQGAINYSFVQDGSWDEKQQSRLKNILYIPANAIQDFLGNQDLFYQQRYYTLGDEQTPTVLQILGSSYSKLDAFSFPESFQIRNLLPLPITKLSNGQLKKVLILKKIVQNIPKILLLDYPFEGLDHQARLDLIVFLQYLHDRFKIQLIVVDHEHVLPSAISHQLVLEHSTVKEISTYNPCLPQVVNTMKMDASEAGDVVMEMKNIKIQYDDTILLKDFSWKVRSGERWALTGKNGSGKTTLFSLIYADHPMAYSQHVYLFGKRRGTGESIWDIKKRINYIGPEVINYLNPKRKRILARDFLKETFPDIRSAELDTIIDFFKANEFMHRSVHTLSSGEQQCMMLMGSLAIERELLLLDEPFQFLDSTRKQMLTDFIQKQLHPQTTLILITHYEPDLAQWTNQRMHIG